MCNATECPPLPGYPHGRFKTELSAQNKVGDKAYLTCDMGYAVNPPVMIECLSDGSWSPAESSCQLDIDECALGTHNCNANASCTNTDGSFTCACNSGYSGDGITCTDIDECALGTHNCNANASCTNTDGSFTCACNSGYSGDGITCTEICIPGASGVPGVSCPLSVAEGCTQDGSTSTDTEGDDIRNVTVCQCNANFDCGVGCQTDAITITNIQYVALLDYYWFIESPPGLKISITFSEVDIETEEQCMYDSVQVFDGPTNASTPAIKFCSNTIPPTFTTTGNQMLVRLETDGGTQGTGFKSTVCFIPV